MKLLQELPLVDRARQLRHTFVQGKDGKHYKILTFQLYEKPPPREFPNWETNVEEVNEKGARFVLMQPLIRRFFDQAEALAFHQTLVDTFDETLKLKEPDPKHKPAAKPAGPAAKP